MSWKWIHGCDEANADQSSKVSVGGVWWRYSIGEGRLMALKIYGLWPIALDRLVSRTGSGYSFLVATVAAQSAYDARRCAKQQDTMGLTWDDPAKFKCEAMETVGDFPLVEGRVYYQWTPQ
jgi:hypothetical protein